MGVFSGSDGVVITWAWSIVVVAVVVHNYVVVVVVVSASACVLVPLWVHERIPQRVHAKPRTSSRRGARRRGQPEARPGGPIPVHTIRGRVCKRAVGGAQWGAIDDHRTCSSNQMILKQTPNKFKLK